MTTVERFMTQVEKTATCWLWTAGLDKNGYGRFWADGRGVRAHRFAYEIFVGPIPAGLAIDHVKARGCTSKSCVNPAHLEPVTNAENSRRAWKTHCANGHAFTIENTYMRPDRGRGCRTCRHEATRRYRASSAV